MCNGCGCGQAVALMNAINASWNIDLQIDYSEDPPSHAHSPSCVKGLGLGCR